MIQDEKKIIIPENGDVFPTLYKYITRCRFIKSKEDYYAGKLYFSKLDKLNDPLEGLPDDIFTDEDKIVGEAFKHDLKECTVCSLSERYDNSAIWAHYAKQHTGVCLVFTIDPEILAKNGIEYAKIKYFDGFPAKEEYEPFMKGFSDEHRSYFMNREEAKQMRWNLIKNILSHKTNDWAYEEEFRLMLPSGDAGLLKVGELKEIICGWKCPSFSENENDKDYVPANMKKLMNSCYAKAPLSPVLKADSNSIALFSDAM
jgi:hypothetical protein